MGSPEHLRRKLSLTVQLSEMELCNGTEVRSTRNNEGPAIPKSPINKEAKTVFNILSNLKETEKARNHATPTELKTKENSADSNSSHENDDIIILRKDPNTKQSVINKSAYLKLHNSSSSNRNSVGKIKEKYEQKGNSRETFKDKKSKLKRIPSFKLDNETIKSIKEKYSPAHLGYSKVTLREHSKPPVPKPRTSIKGVSSSGNYIQNTTLSLDIDKDSKKKDVNFNLIRKESTSSEETITIVRQSDSEESVDKFEKELSYFTMEKPEKKKRSNSFRKIFSGKLFGRDKKKEEKTPNRENNSYTENYQNESNNFNRETPHRSSTGQINKSCDYSQRSNSFSSPVQYNDNRERELRYAQMHIHQFNQFTETLDSQPPSQPSTNYVPIDKPVFKCNQPSNPNYINIPNIKKYIDSSSSASTAESDRSHLCQKEIPSKQNRETNPVTDVDNTDNSLHRSYRFRDETSRDTPPRAVETKCDVRLVNPKALIPINSERALPNPYQNEKTTMDKETDRLISHSATESQQITENKPYFEETYGTVLDSIDNLKFTSRERIIQKPPRSPSLEQTKLKLPPKREIVPLSPRVRSPIPKDDVSTEKIIATELLKHSRSPTPTKKTFRNDSPGHQKLDIDIDYPSNIIINRADDKLEHVRNKPPPYSRLPQIRNENVYTFNRTIQPSPNSDTSKRISQPSPMSAEFADKITTNAMVHVNSSNDRTPTPNRSVTPTRPASIRSSTPVDGRISQSPKTTPQKEDIRRSVEAYYWKEIKKLKEKENHELYNMYQMQNSVSPYGYAEDPVSIRRARSLSPTTQRNTRRSLSLPRDPRHAQINVPVELQENQYGRVQQDIIPEGRAVVNMQRNAMYVQNQYQNFRRNTPERRTFDGISNNYENFSNRTHSLYRPIFKRGSLNTPPPRPFPEDQGNKKVSFSSSNKDNSESWPARNGYLSSPPQRRVDRKPSSLEDDVFLPPENLNGNDVYMYTKPPLRYDYPNEEVYYSTRQNPSQQIMYQKRYAPNSVLSANNSNLTRHQVEECMYGQPVDAIRHPQQLHRHPQQLSRHGSINMEPLYAQRQPRRTSLDMRQGNNYQGQAPRREIIVQDEIYGRFGGYLPNEQLYHPPPNNYLQNKQQPSSVYSSRQSVAESMYGRYPPKQVSVNNKVCDIYGQIHDSRESARQVQSGVMVGQLHRNPASPPVVRQSYNHLPTNDAFVRNTRLTASANDMYRRAQNQQSYGNSAGQSRAEQNYGNSAGQSRVDQNYGSSLPQNRVELNYSNSARYPMHSRTVADNGPPTRPLPPVPRGKRMFLRNHSMLSDSESGSDAKELKRIVDTNAKTKKRGFFGK